MSLAGKTIICTRPLNSENELNLMLRGKGASVIEMPLIQILQNDIDNELYSVFGKLSSFSLCVFTSRNGVLHFFDIATKLNISTDILRQLKFAAYGSKTILELESTGFECLIKSLGKSSEVLLEDIKKFFGTNTAKVLLVLGNMASDLLEKGLPANIGYTRINVYKTLERKSLNEDIKNLISGGEYDLILFTSPSGFRNFARLYGENINNLKTACIGETTAAELLRLGCEPLLVSSMPDATTFANEIDNFFN